MIVRPSDMENAAIRDVETIADELRSIFYTWSI